MSQPILLMIRPRRQAENFVAQCKVEIGKIPRVIYSPLLQIVPTEIALDVGNQDVFIFSSRNAVECLSDRTGIKGKTAICVGEYTAETARNAGFTVDYIGAVVQDVIEFLTVNAHFHGKNLMYIRGDEVSLDLVSQLKSNGVFSDQVIAYEQRILSLTENATSALTSEQVILPVFSRNTAKALASELKGRVMKEVQFLCISDPVSKIVEGISGTTVAVSKDPSRNAMIQSLARMF